MNILMYLLKKYPNASWNWSVLSRNENLTMGIIEKYPNKSWCWSDMSCLNPNINMDIIEKYPNKPWKWYYMGFNSTIEIIDKYHKLIKKRADQVYNL